MPNSSIPRRYLRIVVPGTATKACEIIASPETPPAKVVAALNQIKVPSDESDVASIPQPLREAIVELADNVSEAAGAALQRRNMVSMVLKAMSRPIMIWLCDQPSEESTTNQHMPISVIDTDGLWPYVDESGHVVVHDTQAVAESVGTENMMVFATTLMDLANGRREVRRNTEDMIAQFQDYLKASEARTRLLVQSKVQRPTSN